MKVSVLIPTLNRIRFLKESLASVRRQTHPGLEILVSDDGSTDGSPDYLRELMTHDPRIRLLSRNPEPGLFSNMNFLIKHATGDAFALLGDDDILEPDFVRRLIQPLREHPGVIAAFCDHWIIGAEGRIFHEATEENSRRYGRSTLPAGLVEDPLPHVMRGTFCLGFALYRTSILAGQSFDLSCGGAADVDYLIRAVPLGKLYYMNERLGRYRVHQATATNTRTAFMIEGAVGVLNKYTFSDPRHESVRKDLLRVKYRQQVMYACTEDRQLCWRAAGQYFRLGGSRFDAKILLGCLLACAPRGISRRIRFFKNGKTFSRGQP